MPAGDRHSVRVGRGRDPDSNKAALSAIHQARISPPTNDAPGWVLAFCGGKHDPSKMIRALSAGLDTTQIVGGSAAGVITRGGAGYSGFETAIAVFPASLPPPILLTENHLEAGERSAGARLGARIRAVAARNSVVLLFYDSVAQSDPHQLHPASLLVEGIYDGLNGYPVHIVGGGMLTDMNLTDGYIFDRSVVAKHAVTAVVLPPEIRAETAILHGCVPVSAFLEITKIEGAELFELNGQAALDVIEELLGMPAGESARDALSLMVTLGEKHGDRYAPYDENAYVNRLILSANPARRSITLFEPDFKAGSIVQIMSRDNGLMAESVRRGARLMTERCADLDCLLTLYVDCAGRASARSGSQIEEADILLENLAIDAPFIGFYSGVEIAPVNGCSRPLDWTGVLTTLYRVP